MPPCTCTAPGVSAPLGSVPGRLARDSDVSVQTFPKLMNEREDSS